MTIVDTRQPVPDGSDTQFSPVGNSGSPSSHVIITATWPAWYSALFRIVGRLPASQAFPSATVPSCMSSIKLGVTNEKAGRRLAARSEASWPYATSSLTFEPWRTALVGLQKESLEK